MQRGNTTEEHMTELYDLINKLFDGKDMFYTDEELKELKEKGAITWA